MLHHQLILLLLPILFLESSRGFPTPEEESDEDGPATMISEADQDQNADNVDLEGYKSHEIFFEPEKICRHHQPMIDEEFPVPVNLQDEDHPHNIRKRSLDTQLRIKVFYHESVEKLESNKRDVVKDKVVPEAVSYWEKVLKVRRSKAKIKLQRKCQNNQYFLAPDDPIQYCKEKCVETKCGEFTVPQEHLDACHTCNAAGYDCKKVTDAGDGVADADFILYVSALPTVQCGEAIGEEASTVAYAAHCQQESVLDRPVAGHTNICPEAISTSESDVKSMASTVKHELLHALGFSSSLFAFFRDKNGDPLTERGGDGKPPINRELQVRQWSSKIIKEVKRPWKVRSGTVTRILKMVVTPRVVEEVRKHFNCSDLEGAELEDQGGYGTALTHWEKRLFQNEAMTGTVHTQRPVYSRMTFALLEDSGWYLPNYDMAEEISWGKGLGCNFAKKSCKELMELNVISQDEKSSTKQPFYPFCNKLMQVSPTTSCTADKRAVGSCNLVKFSSAVPKVYQNFDAIEGVDKDDVDQLGGSVTLADFCPYVQEFTWKSTSKTDRGTRCTDPSNSPGEASNYALENYDDQARCFEQASKWEQRSCSMLKQWKRYGAGCYDYKCEDGMLNIVVRNVSIPCEKEGQVLDIRLKNNAWLHQGTLICPRCEDYCDECVEGKKPEVDPKSLQENIENTCFASDINSLKDFLSSFGLRFT